MQKQNKVQVCARVRADVAARIREIADERDTSVSSTVGHLLKHAVRDHYPAPERPASNKG